MSAASEKLRMLANDLDWFNYDLPSEVIHTMRGIAAAMEDELNRMDRWHSAKLQAAMTENARLRELVQDMWRDGMCECDERGACATCEYGYLDRMRELGIEVGG